MKNFKRSLAPLLVSELEKQQPVFQVLTGPRQVGKTTIAQQVMDKLPFPSLSPPLTVPFLRGRNGSKLSGAELRLRLTVRVALYFWCSMRCKRYAAGANP